VHWSTALSVISSGDDRSVLCGFTLPTITVTRDGPCFGDVTRTQRMGG
jgi:hypothetical protein